MSDKGGLRKFLKRLKDSYRLRWIGSCLVMLALAAYISENWYQFVLIQGDSMMPAYHDLQLVVMDKHTDRYAKDDVVAFKCDALNAVLVKRVVGCPGDTVEIHDGKLYVNEMEYPRYSDDTFEYAGILAEKQTLGAGQYIVIGDNIKESKDSRYEYVGIVAEGMIIGKAIRSAKEAEY